MTAKIVIPSTVAIVFLSLLSACASGTQKEPATGGVSEDTEKSVGLDAISQPRGTRGDSESSAAAEVCEDRTCISDSDCCKGDSCGMDPERSHVQRYCLGG